MSKGTIYLRLCPGQTFPTMALPAPYRAMVVADMAVPGDWQAEASDFLVRTGCLYMVAWGINCSSWDDSVDIANLEAFDYKDIPMDSFVMTTWHERDTLEESIWFAKNNAHHPTDVVLANVLVHIGESDRSVELIEVFEIVEQTED